MTITKADKLILDEKLKPYYHINGKEYLCRKCNQPIKSKKIEHYNVCIGLGPKEKYKSLTKTIDEKLDFHSEKCDLGCGNDSKFFYKNGKAYCTNFGNACPVKKENDSVSKKGTNPFEGREHPRGALGLVPWNKGLTKETNSTILKSSQKLSETLKLTIPSMLNKKHTAESKAKIAKATKERGQGGYKIGAGKGKKGWYKGFFCDSSWELAYVIYCLEHSIEIVRNTEKRKYVWKGKEMNYIPDFVVNGKIIEIKGFLSEQSKAKLAANPDITVLYEDDLKHVFSYVIDKYGKDYIKLYEK